MADRVRILLASSNAGKLREYPELAAGAPLDLERIPGFDDLPVFDESAPTFAENAAGKALHYSRFANDIVLADDSGLVVPALGGEPGVHSARFAGANATDSDRNRKLLSRMRRMSGEDRRARFVCVVALSSRGRVLAVVSDSVDGFLAEEPCGTNGFGYDAIFFYPAIGKTFAELDSSKKNPLSHRGKAFQKMLDLFTGPGHLRFS